MLDSETKIFKLENALQETREEIETLEDKISELEENNSELLSENNSLDSENNDLETELHSIRMLLSDLNCGDKDDLERFKQEMSDRWELCEGIYKIFNLSLDGYNNVWSLLHDIKAKYHECHS